MQVCVLPEALPDALSLSSAQVWRCPLPALQRITDRFLARAFATLAAAQVHAIEGLASIAPPRDPFVLVANHSSRRETLYLPALLLLARGGRPIHFLADWNFRLIPGVGILYKRAGAITVAHKDARPRLLNWLKPFFTSAIPPHGLAAGYLRGGRSIGLFPEGSVNRSDNELRRGRFGAARLALESGVPIVPVGIRFGGSDGSSRRIDTSSAISIRIGSALTVPDPRSEPASVALVRHWHARLMTEIGRFAIVPRYRRNLLIAVALMRAATRETVECGFTHYITDVFEDDPHSPYHFHTMVMGFDPVATHERGELACASRRITMILDLKAAYQRLRRRKSWIFRSLTKDWDEQLHARLAV
jgi:1-acyl-sn-glycerol-3-phosphate acyltransferase